MSVSLVNFFDFGSDYSVGFPFLIEWGIYLVIHDFVRGIAVDKFSELSPLSALCSGIVGGSEGGWKSWNMVYDLQRSLLTCKDSFLTGAGAFTKHFGT